MDKQEIVGRMNIITSKIRELEDCNHALCEDLLSTITTEADCHALLKDLQDNIARMYIADKLRSIRSANG